VLRRRRGRLDDLKHAADALVETGVLHLTAPGITGCGAARRRRIRGARQWMRSPVRSIHSRSPARPSVSETIGKAAFPVFSP